MKKKEAYFLIILFLLLLSIPFITLMGIKYLGIELYVNILCAIGVVATFFGLFAAVYAIYLIRKQK